MLAALGRHTDCVHILLEKGAKADAADKKGFTALHRAVSVCLQISCYFKNTMIHQQGLFSLYIQEIWMYFPLK